VTFAEYHKGINNNLASLRLYASSLGFIIPKMISVQDYGADSKEIGVSTDMCGTCLHAYSGRVSMSDQIVQIHVEVGDNGVGGFATPALLCGLYDQLVQLTARLLKFLKDDDDHLHTVKAVAKKFGDTLSLEGALALLELLKPVSVDSNNTDVRELARMNFNEEIEEYLRSIPSFRNKKVTGAILTVCACAVHITADLIVLQVSAEILLSDIASPAPIYRMCARLLRFACFYESIDSSHFTRNERWYAQTGS